MCRKTSNKRFNYTNSAQFVDFVPYRKNRKIEKKKKKEADRSESVPRLVLTRRLPFPVEWKH